MSDRRFDHPTAFQCWEKEEHDAIERVIMSDRFTMGPEVEAFEEEFAQWHGRKHGIMVNSGSSANLVAVAALYEKQNKPLNWMRPSWAKSTSSVSTPSWPMPEDAIVPAIAWSTTYAPFVQHGMDLVPVDIDETWNAPVPQWIPRVKTRVLVVASILGNPGYLAGWRAAADKIGAYLIEDNCESLGAAEDGSGEVLTGTRGDMSTFSFFWSHQISAIEGGMILTDDTELAILCRELRAHGWTRDTLLPTGKFEDEYDFVRFGYNVRPLEMHAAVAREQLKKLRRFIDARRKNFEAFIDACHSPNLPIQFPVPNGRLSPFGLPFCVSGQDARSKLVGRLRAAGIDCRLPTGGSFLRHAYGARWRRYKGDYEVPITPEADRIHRCGLFLGNAPWDMSEQIEKAIGVMREVLL